MSKMLEVRVDQWVIKQSTESDLTIYQENDVPESIGILMNGASKTGKGRGYPDFTVIPTTHRDIIILVENKWGHDNLELQTKTGDIQMSKNAVSSGAVNGAYHYAQHLIKTEDYNEVIFMGVTGEGNMSHGTDIKNKVYYLYDIDEDPKLVKEDVTSLAFLNNDNFEEFYQEISLTEEEKHEALIDSTKELQKTAKELNNLFNDNAILVDQRVVYVSGMLLSMHGGLRPEDLIGRDPNSNLSDGKLVYSYIESYLKGRELATEKVEMMLSTFSNIKIDRDRDVIRESKIKRTGKNKGLYEEPVSINKELFLFIYKHVYETVAKKEHIDTIGELYATFLSYALGDGKENGIVLTPSYTTKLMNQLIGLDRNSRLLDSCTGSGGFLVTGMSMMLEDNIVQHGLEGLGKEELTASNNHIKANNLMGIEMDSKMYTLASTNMILRGDGSSQILKGDAFDVLGTKEVRDFKATHGILNPPFSYTENGMPFTLHTLDALERGGKLAVIIQESTGSGRAIKTNKEILSRHTLEASIKMPGDLFQPSAGVASTIYVLTAHQPHDFRKQVRFIDFSDDGYKRTGRGLREIDNPTQKYQDILDVYNYGTEIEGIPYVDAQITESGDDWNFTSHQIIDTVPTEEDFQKTIGDYLEFQISQIITGRLTIEEVTSGRGV